MENCVCDHQVSCKNDLKKFCRQNTLHFALEFVTFSEKNAFYFASILMAVNTFCDVTLNLLDFEI